MSKQELSSEPPIESQRVPLEREVVLEFEHLSSFIREYSANISLGGMFVKSEKPHHPETVFHFQVRLADDAPLIAGLARVLWVRKEEEASDRPAGMGVRFLELEPEGRALIEQIVREHLARGGEPFRLGEVVKAAVGSVGPPAPGPPAAAPIEEPAEAKSPRTDTSTVIELPLLEDLLAEARGKDTKLTLDTPPRGWKPGTSVARPQTRPQLIGAIALAASIVGALIFFGVRMFATPPVLNESDIERPELPRAERPAEPELPPFTAMEDVTWRRAGNGAEIVVQLDGALPEGSWSIERISDPPRHLLKMSGASRPYPAETHEVGFGGVRQLRTGYHNTGSGNEQHVVVDLIDPRVVLEEAVAEGATVRLRFRRIS